MPKVNVSKDEFYPFFSIDDGWGYDVELTDGNLVIVRAAMEAFAKAQDILADAYSAAAYRRLQERERGIIA